VAEPPFKIVLTPPARRAIAEELPEAVAAAVINFITTVLLPSPHRVGVWSAHRGTYRVLYRIQEERREVVVLRIATTGVTLTAL